jgi:hypothetical protein
LLILFRARSLFNLRHENLLIVLLFEHLELECLSTLEKVHVVRVYLVCPLSLHKETIWSVGHSDSMELFLGADFFDRSWRDIKGGS